MSESKVTGIRGLDKLIYEQIQELAKEKKETVAETVNTALKNHLLASASDDYIQPEVIKDQNKFELTAEALEYLKPLRIKNVDTLLILDENNQLTDKSIEKNLEIIDNVKEIFLPKRLYLPIIKKTRNMGKINTYTGVWKEEKTLRVNNAVLTANILERYKNENFIVKINVSEGDLVIHPDITLELFEEVVKEITVNGNLAVPVDIEASLLVRSTITGIIQLIDKEGNPIDQRQFKEKFFKTNSENVSQLTFSLKPFIKNIAKFAEGVTEDLGSTIQELDKEFSNGNFNRKFIKNKKIRTKISPTSNKE